MLFKMIVSFYINLLVVIYNLIIGCIVCLCVIGVVFANDDESCDIVFDSDICI